jgi:hypothetical protein
MIHIRTETSGAANSPGTNGERRCGGGFATSMKCWRKLCLWFRRQRFDEE